MASLIGQRRISPRMLVMGAVLAVLILVIGGIGLGLALGGQSKPPDTPTINPTVPAAILPTQALVVILATNTEIPPAATLSPTYSTFTPSSLYYPGRRGNRPTSLKRLLGSRSGPSELVSNRIRTSNTHCATSGRQARVLGFRREVVYAATGTPGDQPLYVHLQAPPRVQP